MAIRLLHKNEKGISLIEVVLVIALTGIISSAITMTVFQVFNMNARTSSRMAAIRQVQHAGKIVSEDMLQARDVRPGPPSGFPLTLNWTAGGGGTATYGVTYKLTDRSGVTILWREYYVNGALNSTTKVAEHIDRSRTSIAPTTPCFFPNCSKVEYTFQVTANVGGQIHTETYKVNPRPGS